MDTHIQYGVNDEHFGITSEILKLVSDPTRLRILWVLLHAEHSVNELSEHVVAQPAAVSQHLAKLRASHLVGVRRQGNKMFYAVENQHVRSLVEQALSQAVHIKERLTSE